MRPHLQHTFRLTLRPDGTHLLRLVDVVRYWDLAATEKTIAATNSSRVVMLIRLILDPADKDRPGANQMRQHLSFREHFRRGNAKSASIRMRKCRRKRDERRA